MEDLFLSLIAVYFFVALGFSAKRYFRDEIHEKTIAVFSLYIFQPILTLWGILARPIDIHFILAGASFLGVLILGFLILPFVLTPLTKNEQEKTVIMTASLLGNTGNMGIPIGLALFGPASVPYTIITNFANIIAFSTFGVYWFSKGNMGIKKAIRDIITMPVLWAMILGLFLQYFHISFPSIVFDTLEKGAHTALVLQLTLFGIYMANIKIQRIHWHILIPSFSIKYIFLPALGIGVGTLFHLPPIVQSLLIMQLIMPIAVNNITLASIYNCEVKAVAELTFFTSLASIVIIPVAYFFLHLLT